MSGNTKRFGGNNRGGFRGKKDTRKYTQGKQGKTDEIRRALTHRARVRKNYFKLLEREGMDVPSKDDDNDDNINDNNEKIDSELNKISDDDNTHNSKPLSEIDIIKNKVKKHEPLSFQERIALKKNRRENDKERKMNKTREKLENMRQSNVKRQRQTERIQNTKTRKGQPLMGPRINNLLEKIKQNKNN